MKRLFALALFAGLASCTAPPITPPPVISIPGVPISDASIQSLMLLEESLLVRVDFLAARTNPSISVVQATALKARVREANNAVLAADATRSTGDYNMAVAALAALQSDLGG